MYPGRKTAFICLASIVIWLCSVERSHCDSIAIRSESKEAILSGKFLELKKEAVLFLCDDGSIANLRREKVSKLSIEDNVYATTATDETFAGTIEIDGSTANIRSLSIGSVKVPLKNIVSIRREKKEEKDIPGASLVDSIALVRGKGIEGAEPSQDAASKTEKPGSPRKESIGDDLSGPVPEEMFLRDEQVLVPKGKADVEFNLTFTNKDRSAALLGCDKARSLTPSFTLRYGILDNLLGFVTVPYVINWRETQPDANAATVNRKTQGFGDILFGLNYQLLDEDYRRPALMLSLAAKTDTGRSPYKVADDQESLGTGHWSISPGFSLVKSVDPVVLFGSSYYTYVFPRMIDRPEELDIASDRVQTKPGDSLNMSLGMGFAINEKVDLSFRVQGAYIFRTQYAGKEYGETQTPFYFYTTLDYMLSKNGYVEPSVGFGITKDASDFSLGCSYVYRFR